MGRYYYYNKKATTEESTDISIFRLKERGFNLLSIIGYLLLVRNRLWRCFFKVEGKKFYKIFIFSILIL